MNLVSPAQLARRVNICESTVYRWISLSRIPAPTHSLGGAQGYTEEMARQIERWHAAKALCGPSGVRRTTAPCFAPAETSGHVE